MARKQAWLVVTQDNEGSTNVRRVIADTSYAAEQRIRAFYASVYDFNPAWQVATVLYCYPASIANDPENTIR